MSYTYKVETNYLAGIPQTAIQGGLKPRGIAMHWTAGNPGRAGALATARYFVTAPSRNASYHILVYWDRAYRVFGVMWIVPVDRAAHSMNPGRPLPWEPNAEVRRILGDRWWDPNGVSLAVSFAGMPADLDLAMKDADFIRGYARLIRELSVIPSLDARPLFNHGWGQPSTRYDAGDRLIPAVYRELEGAGPITLPDTSTPPQEVEMDFSKGSHQVPKIVRLLGGSTLYKQATGDDVHWKIPADLTIDVELLHGFGGRWLGRRVGSGSAFFFGSEAIDQKAPIVRAVYPDPSDPTASQAAQAVAAAAVDKAAEF